LLLILAGPPICGVLWLATPMSSNDIEGWDLGAEAEDGFVEASAARVCDVAVDGADREEDEVSAVQD
jgi:hypothetical protein